MSQGHSKGWSFTNTSPSVGCVSASAFSPWHLTLDVAKGVVLATFKPVHPASTLAAQW